MNSTPQSANILNSIDRYRFLMILNAAEQCQEYQFEKDAAMLWLVNFPGDLFVSHHQALALAELDQKDKAISLLEKVTSRDPMFLEPIRALEKLTLANEQRLNYTALVQYLEAKIPPNGSSEKWLAELWNARTAFSNDDLEKAIEHIHGSIVHHPPSAIAAILHLKIAYKMGNQDLLNNLSEIYLQQWPDCLQINVIRALVEIDLGVEAKAIERLHWVAAHDSAGQVIDQLMGVNHRFQDLWPEDLSIHFDLPIPASVSTYLGWNRLNAGRIETPTFAQSSPSKQAPHQRTSGDVTRKIKLTQAPPPVEKSIQDIIDHKVPLKTEPEKWATEDDLEEIQGAFANIAKRLKKPDLERADNRFPVYVVMTSKQQLEKIYGPNTAGIINDLLSNLVSLIQNMPDWGATLFCPDDPELLSPMGIKPVLGTDPYQIKLALADLDNVLAKRGEMIGALLIVGGPEIIPFHNLPNPTFDHDSDVPSDNPYACIDENYYIAQWPVGRLPGETGSDAGLLLDQIRGLIYRYQQRVKYGKSILTNVASMINWILQLFNNLGNSINQQKKQFGYSAEIWKRASSEVYKTIGDAKDLQLSPPLYASALNLNANALKVGYFNLHGVKDGPHWYGQKDFTSTSNGPDYPIALSPNMFDNEHPAPKLVLSEACYGANVLEKRYDEALSLKCLVSGTETFVGSTCIAYGSVTPPLIAADYLAHKFWTKVLEGLPAGYALMQAKLSLAEEMVKMQGFLDGEDQKTLLSFVLYGDPLAVHESLQTMPKPLFRMKTYPTLKTISDFDMMSTGDSDALPKQVNKQVKKVVEKYLPGLENAQMRYTKTGGAWATKSTLEDLTSQTPSPERYVVTLKKTFEEDLETLHHHFARMTFDKKGKLVKFTTSR